jgi:hypothetical protein
LILGLALLPGSAPGQLIEPVEDGVKLGAVRSELQPPTSDVVVPLLETLCPGQVVRSAYFQQLGCGEMHPEPGDSNWRPPLGVNGVLHGHFLSPTSEDVILSGNRLEGHPYRWGGTLLMTRQDGRWKPVWYRAGIITRHCMTLPLATGRQLLICESGYQVNGHKQHALYSLELGQDNPVQQLLFATDSYEAAAEKQTQTVAEVALVRVAGPPLLRVRMRHERHECRKPWYECGEGDLVAVDPVPGEYILEFALQDSRLVLSSASTELFGDLFPALVNVPPEELISHGQPPLPH